jgi:hypothetical protein
MNPAFAHVRHLTAMSVPRIAAAALWSDGERTDARAGCKLAAESPGPRSREGEIASVLARIEGEYREMPGLRLTESQARRLWNLDESTCRLALKALVDAGFLTRFASGAFGVAPSL